LLDDLLGDRLLTAHRVDGHDTAAQHQRLEQFGNGGDLVGFCLRCPLSEHAAVVHCPGAHDVQGSLAALAIVRAAQALAIDGDDFLALISLPNRFDPGAEALLKSRRREQREYPPEGVVGRAAIVERQKLAKPPRVGLAEFFDLRPPIGPTEHRRDGND